MGEAKFEENISMEEALGMEEFESSAGAGEIITGNIVSCDSDFAFLNIGKKQEGRIPLSEFDDKPANGDNVEVLLKSNRPSGGYYSLSKKAAESVKRWNDFLKWYEDKPETVKGTILEKKKTGAIVDFGITTAFLPQTHFADIKISNAIESKQEYDFKILKVDEKKRSILVSRRQYVDELKLKAWDSIVNRYNENDVIKGKVVRIVEFGAFVDLGGFEALVHNNDISWKKVFKKDEYVTINESYDFKILAIDKENRKISLGLKQMTVDPWSEIEKKYPVGTVVKGKVSTITNFGLFLQIDDSIEGLVPLSEISWNRQTINAKNAFNEGDSISAEVISVSPDERKIALSIKNTLENPWHSVEKRFPVGSKHKSKVKKQMAFGIFVELEDGIDGMIHISDLSWDDNASVNDYKKGDTVEFVILDINKKDQKIACGIKQLTKSPWEKIKEQYPVRSKVNGEVIKITSFGMFVKIEEGVEGLVHISEVSRKKIDNIEDIYKVGDKVDVIVQNVDVNKKRISLSIKMLDIIQEKEELDKIMNENVSNTASIGDMIKLKNDEGNN